VNDIVLSVRGLTKRYGHLLAVDQLSLDVRSGEVLGFLGPNGAGKTTSIHMMCGLLNPDSGEVLIHDRAISASDPEIRTRVGLCPQQVVVWERLTCLEQLQFIGEMYGLPGRETRRRGLKLLEDLELDAKRNARAGTLSGGMRRRLNMAMALVHEPEILVLDEPEAGLDPQSRVLVRDYIRSLARRKTVILTTHNMDEAERVADRVAIIDQGRLLVLDSPQALKRCLNEGQIIEVRLNGTSAAVDVNAAVNALSTLPVQVTVDASGPGLMVRTADAVTQLPLIVSALQAGGVPYTEVRLRTGSLEDVFIKLTGRRLRE
jgi:ABC-2 type transport system ATP-binding protein